MKKSLFCVLSVAAVIGTALTSTAASAAVTANAPTGGDPNTRVTFAVTSGTLTLTAPGTADLGTGLPGTTVTGALGTTTVTDDRALLTAAWTVTASSTAFTTGGGTGNETIPASDASYDPGEIATTGTITTTGTDITSFSATPAPVVVGSAGVGNNTATWNPTIAINIPPAAVGGTYTGTITQSVS
jgi:hypothetical protein